MRYPLEPNTYQDSEIHREISRYELLYCQDLINNLGLIEAALLPLIRNWIYLYLSSDYQVSLPFFRPITSTILENFLYLPEAIVTSINTGQYICTKKPPRKPIAVLKEDEVTILKGASRYGLSISGDYIISKQTGQHLMPYLHEENISEPSDSAVSASRLSILRFDGECIFQGLSSYVQGIIGQRLNLVALSQFTIECAKFVLRLKACDSLVPYDAICYFNVYGTASSAINMYCMSRNIISLEIAHGAYFSIYAHEDRIPSPFMPRFTFDPYDTLRCLFERFRPDYLVGSSFFAFTQNDWNIAFAKRIERRKRRYFLLDAKQSIASISKAIIDRGFNEVYLFDNLRCNEITALPVLLTEFFEANKHSDFLAKSKIFLVSHPILGISNAVQGLCVKHGLSYELVSGFDEVRERLALNTSAETGACLITYTESAVWRDILSLENYVHLHIGSTPLGKYLLLADRGN